MVLLLEHAPSATGQAVPDGSVLGLRGGAPWGPSKLWEVRGGNGCLISWLSINGSDKESGNSSSGLLLVPALPISLAVVAP